jgi:cytochrome c oxidase cbb3-type subunit III
MPTKIEKDQLTGRETTGHDWDGLKELNTPLPRWWLYTFYACILFALVWVVLYPALPISGAGGLLGYTSRQALDASLVEEGAARAPMLARIGKATPAQIVADPELRAFAVAGGRIAFANNCAPCHGSGGQGAAGGYPNLADDDWLWGGSLTAIHQTIEHGIRNTQDPAARVSQMPRFLQTGTLKAAQVDDVAEYVLSLSGTGTDPAAARRGAPLYAEGCVACHGEKGEGNQELGAPRLSDRIWLYGGDKASVTQSIGYARAGVMPPWAGRLDPATINMLTVFVHSLGGGE